MMQYYMIFYEIQKILARLTQYFYDSWKDFFGY